MALSGSRRRTPLLGAAALFVGAAALLLAPAVALATSTTGIASGAQPSPRVTVAAIDPSLVTGRGAQLGIVEQEAENAATNGTTLSFDTSAYSLSPSRSLSGRTR